MQPWKGDACSCHTYSHTNHAAFSNARSQQSTSYKYWGHSNSSTVITKPIAY